MEPHVNVLHDVRASRFYDLPWRFSRTVFPTDSSTLRSGTGAEHCPGMMTAITLAAVMKKAHALPGSFHSSLPGGMTPLLPIVLTPPAPAYRWPSIFHLNGRPQRRTYLQNLANTPHPPPHQFSFFRNQKNVSNAVSRVIGSPPANPM